MPRSHNSSELLHGVVEALGDALNRHDQQLLQDIRNIATGREARRGAILNELQALAASIGMFLPAREPVESVVISQENRPPYAPAGGDWRLAELEFYLNCHLNGNGSPH